MVLGKTGFFLGKIGRDVLFSENCLEATQLQLCHMSRFFCVGRCVAPSFSPLNFEPQRGNFGVSPQLNGEVSDSNHSTTNLITIYRYLESQICGRG